MQDLHNPPIWMDNPTIWRMMKKGTFPKSVSASNRRVAWVAKDIEKWLAERG